MRIDRQFDKNYYKHKKTKYLTRESLGGYDLVRNRKTGKKTRRYRYKYTYPKAAGVKSRIVDVATKASVHTYIKMRNDLQGEKSRRAMGGLFMATEPMRLKEEKTQQMYSRFSSKEKLQIEYQDAVSELSFMQVYTASQPKSYLSSVKKQEEKVLELAIQLGLYHPKSKIWFKLSNRKLLRKLKINKVV